MDINYIFMHLFKSLCNMILFVPRLISFILKLLFIIDKRGDDMPTIYFDKSNVFFSDIGTGIQRVTKELNKSLKLICKDYKIVDVYSKKYFGYYSCETNKLVKPKKNDVFLGVDHSMDTIPTNKLFFYYMYKKGVDLEFFVYDIIPLLYPEYAMSPKFVKKFKKWLYTIIKYNGIITDSISVMDEIKIFLANHKVRYNKNLKFNYVHPGADFICSELNGNIKKSSKVTFLMVSTVEPRKKYDQVVKAFNILWEKGYDINLRIVGKKGWNNQETINLIQNNKYKDRYLYWYNDGISDKRLCELYEDCDCVILASLCEGFGLSVIEASYFNKPLILRDIPVFREIVDNGAFFFNSFSEYDLAERIINWLELYKDNKICVPTVKQITWVDSSKKLLEIIKKR